MEAEWPVAISWGWVWAYKPSLLVQTWCNLAVRSTPRGQRCSFSVPRSCWGGSLWLRVLTGIYRRQQWVLCLSPGGHSPGKLLSPLGKPNSFPSPSDGRESACNVGDAGSIPRWARSLEEGHSNPFQCSCLENPLDRGAWQASTVHRVTKNHTQLKQLSIHTHIPHKRRVTKR